RSSRSRAAAARRPTRSTEGSGRPRGRGGAGLARGWAPARAGGRAREPGGRGGGAAGEGEHGPSAPADAPNSYCGNSLDSADQSNETKRWATFSSRETLPHDDEVPEGRSTREIQAANRLCPAGADVHGGPPGEELHHRRDRRVFPD